MTRKQRKQLGISRCQGGGDNGYPINPRPKEARPKPPVPSPIRIIKENGEERNPRGCPQTLEIMGIKYSRQFFEEFAHRLPFDCLFKFIKREDGVVTIERIEEKIND